MKSIKPTIISSGPVREVLAQAGRKGPGGETEATGLSGSLTSFLAAAAYDEFPSGLLVVAPDDEGAEKLRDDCAALAGTGHVKLFGTRPLHHAQALDLSASIAQIETLEALAAGKKSLVIASPRSLSERVPPPDSFRKSVIAIAAGADYPFDDLLRRLDECGFERRDFVGGYGEYSVRGGIVDIYPYSGDNPVRVEFWGDRVESIREFDPLSQRSIGELETASIVPNISGENAPGDPVNASAAPSASLLSYLEKDAVVIILEPEMIRAEFDEMTNEGLLPEIPFEEVMDRLARFARISCSLTGRRRKETVDFGSTPQPAFNGNLSALVREIRARSAEGFTVRLTCNTQTEATRLEVLLTEHLAAPDSLLDPLAGRRTAGGDEAGAVVAGDDSTSPDDAVPEYDATPQDDGTLRGTPLSYTIVPSSLHSGFIFRPAKLAVFTEHEIFGRQKQRGLARRRRLKGITQKELLQLKKGDFVVHTDHGIGKFAGLTKIRVGGAEQEVMKMLFLEDDTLYVNLNYVNRVQKYVASEGHAPTLHRLGGGEWEKTRARAKKRIKDIARDIIAVYARRKHEKGFPFSPDSHWQKEMEASFLFEDTPDQATATADVKKDMESAAPMDRLICGDVGFGKTEIAVRAAFKSVLDGKQVAVLVPTTILAHQHYNTFRDRLSRYSARIENLTRFKSKKDQTAIVKDLATGGVDVVIGTHRLLSKDIRFKDLGLLVIDEEHRFGVSAKEKLRKLKATVDTLAMTATPIPRTLQFSLIGSRDLSLMATPPRNRLAVNTEIVPAEAGTRELHREVIREAIVRELHRGGQVYFVHDRVGDLDTIARQISDIVPVAKIQVAHGQMAGHELEKAMLGFMEKRSNVLLCTKIIESGLDIPNVNTIIINRADRFGLAELYQLRGRVGRSNVQAYAYLLTPPLTAVPRTTLRRLQALEEFTELGSGFNLAMRDLEIRGAGNLLGGEQSGFIAEMGFETYERVILEAVDELKREEFGGVFDREKDEAHPLRVVETVVDADVEALIPDVYIESDTERLDLYRRLYRTGEAAELKSMKEELLDRFGEYPEEVENLFSIVELKQAATALKFPKVSLSADTLTITLPDQSDESFYGKPDSADSPFQLLMAKVASSGRGRIRLREQEKKLTLVVSGISGDGSAKRLSAAAAALAEVGSYSPRT
ncbi:MAG TPA: transcription-repair coupling factor [Bacteroidota bacterium]|nr:transcription-repair coupling factor [Bacteroidota bacterium]